jgi:hypothetical protein
VACRLGLDGSLPSTDLTTVYFCRDPVVIQNAIVESFGGQCR